MKRSIEAGARVGGKRARPPEDDVVKLNDYKAASLLQGMVRVSAWTTPGGPR